MAKNAGGAGLWRSASYAEGCAAYADGCAAYAEGCAAYAVGCAAYVEGFAAYVRHCENIANSVQLSLAKVSRLFQESFLF